MKLIYRGVSYEHSPNAIAPDAFAREGMVEPRVPLNLVYRGVAYTANPGVPLAQPIFKPIAQLIYRGVSYGLNGWQKKAYAAGSAVAQPQQAAVEGDLVSTHRQNLYSNVQRRLQVARERGDQTLINLLEQELKQIA